MTEITHALTINYKHRIDFDIENNLKDETLLGVTIEYGRTGYLDKAGAEALIAFVQGHLEKLS